MKYSIGDLLFFVERTNKIMTMGTIFDVRKDEQAVAIYNVFHSETGYTYQYPEWHLNLHTRKAKDYINGE